jgi:hypothetical protein
MDDEEHGEESDVKVLKAGNIVGGFYPLVRNNALQIIRFNEILPGRIFEKLRADFPAVFLKLLRSDWL